VLGEDFERTLGAARTGAEWAWTSIYLDLAPSVLGYLRRREALEPEDLTGEVFLQVVRDVRGFPGGERVRRILGQLAPDQRTVLLLRVLGELTVEEVARIVGKSTGPVKALQRRGLRAAARRRRAGTPGQPGRRAAGERRRRHAGRRLKTLRRRRADRLLRAKQADSSLNGG
jgi:RNA polymerase sigma-70 factor (ECF subfamily)